LIPIRDTVPTRSPPLAVWIFGDNVEERMGPFRFVCFTSCAGWRAGSYMFLPFFFELPAVTYLAFWAISQALGGTLSLAAGAVVGIAFWAHVGGFVAGITLHFLFVKQRFLEASRQRLIAKIEQDRGSRVILLVHRQETMSLLGFPLMRYIDVNDSEAVLRAIHLTDPAVPLDIVLHTPGGLVLASLQIARAIHKHKGKVTAVVPHYAMSGGTLIALAAAEIAIPQVRDSVRELLADKTTPDKADELARLLSEGTWTHDHPITFETARAFGLPVRSDIPPEFMDLMALYPQPVRRQPGVEYLPQRRNAQGSPAPRA